MTTPTSSYRSLLTISTAILWWSINPLHAQTVKSIESNIASTPPDSSGNYEKVIGHFTATDHVSYFLGTNTTAYIIDPARGLTITVANDGRHYERAKAYKAEPNDQYDSIIASAGNGNGQLVAYWNPANRDGGDATQAWTRYVIYGGSGCHDLYVQDFDGDGKPDVACSGTLVDNNAPAFIMFQNANNNWTGPVYAVIAGDGIAPVAINGVNGGARTNLVGCNGGTLYWYRNMGRSPNWPGYPIGDCNEGVSIGTLPVQGRDIVAVASNEDEPTQWSSGFAYYDPGTPANPTSWTKVIVDSTYTSVHQIACDTYNGASFCTLGEQEQASTVCNSGGHNTESENGGTYPGCRVAVFPWVEGHGFVTPTFVSSMGTQNQALYQQPDGEYMAGANHCVLGGYDCAYHLWKLTFSTGSGAAGSLWNGGGTPAGNTVWLPVELGLEFEVSQPGQIQGVSFYKSSLDTQTSHQVHLWSSSGQLLAKGQTSNESASGWQTASFSSPVSIQANTIYEASYFSPTGAFAYTNNFFTNALTVGSVTVPSTSQVANGNGVYARSSVSTFPSSTYNARNYWIDIQFEPAQ